MAKGKIEITDSVSDIVAKLSEGSSEAAEILNMVVEQSPNIDPSAVYREYTPLINCDAIRLYGKHIVGLFNAVDRRVDYFLAVLRASQLKILSKTKIKQAIYGNIQPLNIQHTLHLLTERVPDFQFQHQHVMAST